MQHASVVFSHTWFHRGKRSCTASELSFKRPPTDQLDVVFVLTQLLQQVWRVHRALTLAVLILVRLLIAACLCHWNQLSLMLLLLLMLMVVMMSLMLLTLVSQSHLTALWEHQLLQAEILLALQTQLMLVTSRRLVDQLGVQTDYVESGTGP